MESYKDRQQARLAAKEAIKEQKRAVKEAEKEQKEINRIQRQTDRRLASEERRQLSKLYKQWAAETAKLLKAGASDKDISVFLRSCDLDHDKILAMAQTRIFKENIVDQSILLFLNGATETNVVEYINRALQENEKQIDVNDLKIESLLETVKFKLEEKKSSLIDELSNEMKKHLVNGELLDEIDIQSLQKTYYVDKDTVEKQFAESARKMYHSEIIKLSDSSEDKIESLLFLANILGKDKEDVRTDIEDVLKKKRKDERKASVKTIISRCVWGAAAVGIVLQIIFLGWWTILLGLVTIIIAFIINNVFLD